MHRLSPLAACGMVPDQASNLSPLHWRADSQPLDPQGSCGTMSSLKGGLTEGLINQTCVPGRRFLEDDKVSLSLQGKLMVLVTSDELQAFIKDRDFEKTCTHHQELANSPNYRCFS